MGVTKVGYSSEHQDEVTKLEILNDAEPLELKVNLVTSRSKQ